MELTEQDLKAIRQMVRFEVRLAVKHMYDRMVYEYPLPSPSFSVVGAPSVMRVDPGPLDDEWVDRS